MAVIGDAWVKVKADTAEFGPQVEKDVVGAISKAGSKAAGAFRSAVSSTVGAIGSTLAAGFKVGATAAAGFTGAVLAAGTAYNVLGQKSTAAFKTLLGTTEAAEQMMADLSEFAKTSPFPRQAFIAGTQQLLGFGMEAKRIIPTLDAIQQAVAATGGSAQDIEEIVYVLAQVEGTGKITANTLNMLGMRGINAAELIGKSMGKTGNEIRDEITKGTLDASAAVDALVEGMQERFGGAAEGLKGTWLGAVDRIKGAMRDIGSALMEPFIGFTGGGAFTEFANTIADALRKVESEIVPVIVPMLETVAGHLTGLGETIASVFDRLGEGGINSLLERLDGMLPIISGIGAAFASSFGGSLPVIGNMLAGLNPVVVGLATLVATSEPLRAAFAEAFTAVGPILGEVATVVRDVVSLFGSALTPILEGVADIFVGIAPALGVFAEMLREVANTVGVAFSGAMKVLMPSLTEFVVALVDGLTPILPVLVQAFDAVAGVLPVVAGAFASIFDALTPLLSPELIDAMLMLFSPWYAAIKILTPVIPLIGELIGLLAEMAGEILARLAPALPPLVEAIELVVGALAEGLMDVIIALVPALGPLADALVELVVAITPILPPLAELIVLLLDKLGVPVLVLLAKTLTVVATAFGKIATFVARVLGSGIEILASVITGISDALAGLDFGKLIGALGKLPGLIAKALGGLGKSIGAAFTGALTAVAKELPKAVSAITKWFSDLPSNLVKTLASLGATLAGAFGAAFVAVVSALPGAVAQVLGFFVGLPVQIQLALVSLGLKLIEVVTGAVAALIGALPGIVSGVIGFFTALPGRIISALAQLTSLLTQLFSSAFTAVQTRVASAVSTLISFLAGLPGRAVAAIASIATTLPAKMGEAMASLLSRVNTGVQNVVSAIAGLPGKMLNSLSSLGSAAVSLGKEVINGLGRGIAQVGSFATDVASSLWNAFKRLINENVIDKVRNYEVKISVMGRTLYSGHPFGSLPRLARGGLVPAQPGGQLAVVGEGGYDEVVLSTNPAYRARNRALLAQAGLSDLGATSNVSFGPESIVVRFEGAIPTPAEARRVGQNVGEGISQVLAERRVERSARAI